jgi:hypothetical protein
MDTAHKLETKFLGKYKYINVNMKCDVPVKYVSSKLRKNCKMKQLLKDVVMHEQVGGVEHPSLPPPVVP